VCFAVKGKELEQKRFNFLLAGLRSVQVQRCYSGLVLSGNREVSHNMGLNRLEMRISLSTFPEAQM
jgi:hypothetical protein